MGLRSTDAGVLASGGGHIRSDIVHSGTIGTPDAITIVGGNG